MKNICIKLFRRDMHRHLLEFDADMDAAQFICFHIVDYWKKLPAGQQNVAIPPEERSGLIDHFLKGKRLELKREKVLSLTKTARAALLAYPFPGNIREMENLIEQLYVFHDTEVSVPVLPIRIQRPTAANSLKWADVEKTHIQKVMQLAKGNKNRALNYLGYGSINTLQGKLKSYGLISEE